MRGRRRKWLRKGRIGQAFVQFYSDATDAAPLGIASQASIANFRINVPPALHIYVVLRRRHRRASVAWVDGNWALADFCRQFGVTDPATLEYYSLTDIEQAVFLPRLQRGTGIRRTDQSHWW